MRRRGGASKATRASRRAGHVLASCAAMGLVALFASTNVACVATATSPPPRGVVVNGPPPPPVVETRGAPPGPNATWVAGYWHWAGAQYMWIPGHWESAPPGATWYAPKYVAAEGTYYYEPGGWRNDGSAAPPAPPQGTANARALH